MANQARPARQRGREVDANGSTPEHVTTVNVMLGGREYALTPLTLGPARAWRASLKGPFERLTTLLQSAPSMDITDLRQLIAIVQLAGDVLIEAPDIVADLLWGYAPEVFTAEERAWLDGHAYDTEIVPAFMACLRQVYPLDRLIASLGR